MNPKYPELKAGQSVLVTKTGGIEWVSSIDYVYNVAKTKLLSSRPKDRCYNSYWNVFNNKFSVHGARVVSFDKEALDIIREDLQCILGMVKHVAINLDEVFTVYTENRISELLEKYNEKLPELRSEFKTMILAALEDNKKN